METNESEFHGRYSSFIRLLSVEVFSLDNGKTRRLVGRVHKEKPALLFLDSEAISKDPKNSKAVSRSNER